MTDDSYLKIEIDPDGSLVYYRCTKGEPDSIVKESCVEVSEAEYTDWLDMMCDKYGV